VLEQEHQGSHPCSVRCRGSSRYRRRTLGVEVGDGLSEDWIERVPRVEQVFGEVVDTVGRPADWESRSGVIDVSDSLCKQGRVQVERSQDMGIMMVQLA